MKFEMTDRDKKLLIFLSVFVIVVCIGYWGIYPVIKDIKNIDKKIETEKDKEEMNQLKISQLPIIETENERMKEEIVGARESYYQIMSSNEIDKHFTNMVLTSGLYSYDLNISISKDTTSLEPYQYSKKALLASDEYVSDDDSDYDSADDYLNEDEDDESLDLSDVEDYTSTGIYTAVITMKIGGDEDKLIAFLDSLCNTDKKLRIVNYNFSEEKSIEYNVSDGDDETEGYDIKSNMILNVTFEIYMCEE
ncbi:MAG: hypothetical protein IJT72_02445 [Lachnospiraceae bacterium]|nr:hypothetical protein [Lachnospiraceae bacterium]